MSEKNSSASTIRLAILVGILVVVGLLFGYDFLIALLQEETI